jgi:hypothetical protein
MAWMGHLPALAAGRLDRALVICFGTGQTANAVRQHHPRHLDLVDISRDVLAAASWFVSNQGVLHDPVARPTVMDGRAFLRRSRARFDIVTLEPMPPNFAGTNSLYSREFYRLVRERLSDDGAVAQWVPFHLIAPDDMRSIVRTFIDAFPYARMWIDDGGTGILVGRTLPWTRPTAPLRVVPLSPHQIEARYEYAPADLERVAQGAAAVTDDNQLLAYGTARLDRSSSGNKGWSRDLLRRNQAILRGERSRFPLPVP